jgi:hypothetical protein
LWFWPATRGRSSDGVCKSCAKTAAGKGNSLILARHLDLLEHFIANGKLKAQ